jgi:hypothetical protein
VWRDSGNSAEDVRGLDARGTVAAA